MFCNVKEPSHFTDFPKLVPATRDELIEPRCFAACAVSFLQYHSSHSGLPGALLEPQGVLKAKMWNPGSPPLD